MIDQKRILAMREGGKKLATVRQQVAAKIKPGVSLRQLDSLADKLIRQSGGEPGFQLVPGYHFATCINLNRGIVHGIPDDTVIKPGDMVTVDIGLYFMGYHTDTATTVVAGEETAEQKRFLQTGREALAQAIAQTQPGNRVGHISQAIENRVKASGFRCVRSLTGHGVGKTLHEPPMIPGVLLGDIDHTPLLEPGMTLAIEVIYVTGSDETEKLPDGWTIVTKDGGLAAVFEETVLVGKEGVEILTRQGAYTPGYVT